MVEAPEQAGRRSRRRDELILDALERLLASAPMSDIDVEAIATEAGITRTRFYAYFPSKFEALAALLRRLIDVRNTAYQHKDSWFVGRAPGVRPRASLHMTIGMTIDRGWPHRFVLRESCDLWTAVPVVREAKIEVMNAAIAQIEGAILRERALGIAPSGLDAYRLAQTLAWETERLHFLAWAEFPGSMTKQELHLACLETYMRMIFLADDPDG